ncbi:hypothetical protein [Streptantibioticus ferralitis]|uniref:Uncharacterized protein n=1 Tax=Streptantibioticus ferralitis TaxID=236510 RepID=A0ABT5Z1P2_9ACTN|nr:hypothetical protein [Streptantibioticus ferralitis]MDF2257683.1 hypothetical protein [Streptantibioticus ferralitis]
MAGLETDQIIRVTARHSTPLHAFDGHLLGVSTEGLHVLAYDDGEMHWVDAECVEHAEVR